MARPHQEVPLQFLVERGVIGGLIPVASNSLNASSVLGVLGSSRAQSVGMLNGTNSGCRVVLPRETDKFLCSGEPICHDNKLAFLMGAGSMSRGEPICHDCKLAFLIGTGFVQLRELTGF